MTTAKSAAYLYCIVRASRRPSAARVPGGLPDADPPAAHRAAPSLWVVSANVPLRVYGPQQLEPRLRDLDWVAEAAIAHESVVEHFARPRTSTVIPMKLFTMFSSVDKAIADVVSRRDAIQRAMRRIAGAEEWGVRVFRRPEAAAAAAGTGRAASGADFLRARKQARDAAAAARSAAAGAADLAFARLRRIARDARVREVRQEPGSNPPILDAAFLVASSARARFAAEARRQTAALAAAGADVAVTGPWPAYNFVTTEDSA
jgi:hypothetical protein